MADKGAVRSLECQTRTQESDRIFKVRSLRAKKAIKLSPQTWLRPYVTLTLRLRSLGWKKGFKAYNMRPVS